MRVYILNKTLYLLSDVFAHANVTKPISILEKMNIMEFHKKGKGKNKHLSY